MPLYQIFSLDHRSVGTVFFWATSELVEMTIKAKRIALRIVVEIFTDQTAEIEFSIGKLSPHVR